MISVNTTNGMCVYAVTPMVVHFNIYKIIAEILYPFVTRQVFN